MAILDARLVPLIETLTATGADWLAFEIIDGLRLGRVKEETLDTLQNTRETLRAAKRQKRHSEQRAILPPPAMPILGDEQIEWAAEYVTNRMVDVTIMLQAALDQLEAVLAGAHIADGEPPAHGRKAEITLVLHGREGEISVRRSEVAKAIALVPRLEESLRSWAATARRGGTVE